jgi:hypothetical protein
MSTSEPAAGPGKANDSQARSAALSTRLIQAMTGHPALSEHDHMRTSHDQPRPGRTDTSSRSKARLLDDLLDGYVGWRESARAAADAYGRWSFACGQERALRFAAYTATLDQEQKTASAYAEAVTDVERWLRRSDSHRGL